ncbi:Transposon Tn21 resolvase [Serinicoccus hydrothermalis]|uniref:Transposon Tn21 resolvase n=1 Tax=Serinicoccus hydrothermalis TaxID=1758689 RepID=A0A1B1NGT0_9MICO|nr:recombinase family protein [Serinicoccus hydrothermalis]ANS80628.1 Transposon Tn21 resolvase [Serinicoccus hydrothermalis]
MSGQVVGYVRVSSTDQNPARQHQSIREAVGEPDRIFEDQCSGATADRPGLAALLAHLREDDTLVVSSMDRLARSVIDLHALVDGLTDRGVSVRFLHESLSFRPGESDPTGRLLLGVMGSVAAFERAMIRERQAEGIALAKQRGVYKGRARRLTPDQIEQAQTQVESGVPVARVAREAGVSRQTLYDALNRRGAYGEGAAKVG